MFFSEILSVTDRSNESTTATAADAIESAQSRLLNVQSILRKKFKIGSKVRTPHQQLRTAPPGSEMAFLSWNESFLSEGIHSFMSLPSSLECNSWYIDEDWSSCLRLPQHYSCSPTKTDSSSTHIENGQVLASPFKAAEIRDTGANDSDEVKCRSERSQRQVGVEVKGLNYSSELSHDYLCVKDDSKVIGNDGGKVNGECRQKNNIYQHGDNDGRVSGESQARPDKDSEGSQMVALRNKRQLFETSWSLVNASISHHPTLLSSQRHINGSSTLLTSCANALSRSYLTNKEMASAAQQIEEYIERTSYEIKHFLEKMIPARGGIAYGRTSRSPMHSRLPSILQSNALGVLLPPESGADRMKELIRLYKEAVTAKFGLLLIPKR